VFLALEGRSRFNQPEKGVLNGILGISRILHVSKAHTVNGLFMTLVDIRNLIVRT
jgi:hypothetical protein